MQSGKPNSGETEGHESAPVISEDSQKYIKQLQIWESNFGEDAQNACHDLRTKLQSVVSDIEELNGKNILVKAATCLRLYNADFRKIMFANLIINERRDFGEYNKEFAHLQSDRRIHDFLVDLRDITNSLSFDASQYFRAFLSKLLNKRLRCKLRRNTSLIRNR